MNAPHKQETLYSKAHDKLADQFEKDYSALVAAKHEIFKHEKLIEKLKNAGIKARGNSGVVGGEVWHCISVNHDDHPEIRATMKAFGAIDTHESIDEVYARVDYKLDGYSDFTLNIWGETAQVPA